MEQNDFIAAPDDLLLITGATGFIGPKVVESLLELGFRNLRCFARPSSDAPRIIAIAEKHRGSAQIEVMKGNLLSREDCDRAMKDVAVVYHLSTGKDGKSFPDAFMNSVVTTRNLLEPGTRSKSLKRFRKHQLVRRIHKSWKSYSGTTRRVVCRGITPRSSRQRLLLRKNKAG